jgi:murein DD-endopeptidase MepM/ murein hydrolase activator NlpD
MSQFVWPVPDWEMQYSYHDRPRAFGSPRDGGKRKHAGCDLYAQLGSPVVAVYHGWVIRVYEFYGKADAIEVNHGVHGIIRYGEVDALPGIAAGMLVTAGTQIGTIAQLVELGNIHPMLHFELYSGKATGKLTQASGDYKRRSDLLDPTSFLDKLRPSATLERTFAFA